MRISIQKFSGQRFLSGFQWKSFQERGFCKEYNRRAIRKDVSVRISKEKVSRDRFRKDFNRKLVRAEISVRISIEKLSR